MPKPPKAQKTGRPVRVRTLALSILLLAMFLRFYQLPTLPAGIQVDEAMNGCNILQILETGKFHVFYPENMGREGMFINIQAFFSSILGNEPWVLRLVSAIFGVLTVWTTWLLMSEISSPEIGLFAAFFLATSFWHLMLSRLGTRAISAPFFLTLSLWLMFVAIRRMREGKPFVVHTILAGIVYGLGFHSYTAFRVTPVLAGGIFAYAFVVARKQFWRFAAILTMTAALVVAPLILYFIRNPAAAVGRASQISVFRTAKNPALEILLNIGKTAQMFFFVGDKGWRHNYDSRAELFWPVAILFAIGVGLAIVAVWKRTDAQRAFTSALLLVWIAVAAIPAIVSGEGVPHALRTVLMIPAVAAIAALGAQWAYSRLKMSWRTALLAAFLLFVAWDPYHTYFDLWLNHPEIPGHFSDSLVRLAGQFNQMPRTNPRYLAVTATGPPANGIPVLMMPFTYVTRSYTQKEQRETKIYYITPESFRLQPGKNFCQAVIASMPGAPVTCVNLRY